MRILISVLLLAGCGFGKKTTKETEVKGAEPAAEVRTDPEEAARDTGTPGLPEDDVEAPDADDVEE